VINEILDIYPQYATSQHQNIINEAMLETVGHIDRYNILEKLNKYDFNEEYHFKSEMEKLLKGKRIKDEDKETILKLPKKPLNKRKGC